MTTATISELTSLTPPMTGTELLEIERDVDGTPTSFKVMAGDVAQSPPAPNTIVSAAISADLDPLSLYYEVTTGGSAGAELLNLPAPELTDGFNAQFINRRMVLSLVAKGDPADVLQITVDGSAQTQVLNGSAQVYPRFLTDMTMSTVGQAICFVWCGDFWAVDRGIVDTNFDSTPVATLVSLSAGPGQQFFITGLPTADPGVFNALYTDGAPSAGVPRALMVSGG